nr:hypothetical protein [Acidithiobacillus caldus]
MIARRTAVTNDLLADDGYIQKVDAIGDPLQKIEAVVDFSALAQAVERIFPRPEQPKGGRPHPLAHLLRIGGLCLGFLALWPCITLQGR